MARKSKNSEIVAGNPLIATGVEKMILVIRDKQVLLDRDLATLYGVETKRIKEQVKRNIERFPEDFCFQLSESEFSDWRSQIATSNADKMGLRYAPFVFTEQGVAMLSSVLKSESAIRVNIAIMRAFVQLRHYMMGSEGVVNRLVHVESKEIEQDRRLLEHDHKIDSLFEAMDRRETELQKVMENFVDPSTFKHFLILNGQKLDADVAYTQIYGMAKKSITIIDDYIGVKTLDLLRGIAKGVSVTIYSDENGYESLTEQIQKDFLKARPDVKFNKRKTKKKFHDRYIFLDYGLKGEKLFHCGASSKDAGNKITTIMQIENTEIYHVLMEKLAINPRL